MVDPQPTLVALLVRHVLLPRELLPQIAINSPDQVQPLIRTGQREGVPPDAVGPLPWGMAPGVTADESSCERHTNTGESWQYIASRTSAGAPRPPGVSGR
jgi:hypothetical protein